MLKVMMAGVMLLLANVQVMAATPFDQAFLRSEAQGSAYELAIARLAQTRATRPDVRAYAATLVNDHENHGKSLRDLAHSKQVALPAGMPPASKQQFDQLARVRGDAFDSAFIREARRINGKDIRTSRAEANRMTDPDVRRFVARSLEMDEKHESGARALSDRTFASTMPMYQPPSMCGSSPVISPPVDGTLPVISPSQAVTASCLEAWTSSEQTAS